MICPNCSAENRPGARFCAKCGASLMTETVAWTPPSPVESPHFPSSPPPPPPPLVSVSAGPVQVEKRYPVLRVLSVVYKVLGGIVGGLTLLAAIAFCVAGFAGSAAFEDLGIFPSLGGAIGGLVAGFVLLLYGGFIAITLYAGGEFVSLLISIEENIRTLTQK
ncbi:MAG: zinc ribbon domain-containing protein [Anaerolineae bacterium]|nr:zinc ribbon domain-containing protein [Anaerolineae bacterium]MCX8067352.1 zinc ribbon domain-containing protein [Anaerolineae bacterium]MDW7990874.1 zinc ribbon domain-containing protein [Anaerolineae bacterium]